MYLVNINDIDSGLQIGGVKYNSVAYADDVTLANPTVTGLQLLIDRCFNHSHMWRLNYGINKSNCMIHGTNLFVSSPSWYMYLSD